MTKRMTFRALLKPNALLALVGLFAGVIGATAAGRLLDARAISVESALNARYAPREVVVAARDVAAGETIEGGMLASRRMPRDFLPAGALGTSQVGTLVGRKVNVGLRRGDPVQLSALHVRNERALSDVIRSGGRALTISVDDTNSMSGLLRAGDIVDIYYSRSQNGSSVLVPLLERVEVLATGESLKSPQADISGTQEGVRTFATLTIHVSPEDAARIVLAQATGTLTVLLRSMKDEAKSSVDTRNSRYLLTGTPGRPVEGRRAESVELIVGGSGSVVPEISRLTVGMGFSPGGRT
jgi:pilus assembly protein CpaB